MLWCINPAVETTDGRVPYLRRGGDGHFVGFEPLVCGNDAEEIEKGKATCRSQ
jgi:hypothetical protein